MSVIDEKTIIELKQYLRNKTGKEYFRDFRFTPNNIILTCPFHKSGQEHKPSANLRITEGPNTYIGNFHCFTCGLSMDILSMLKRILGSQYDEDEIESKFQFKSLIVQSEFAQNKFANMFTIPNNSNVLQESELREYRFYNTYLQSRGINEETANKFDIGFDEHNNQITFPIRDINRVCLGLGRRNIYNKRYLYPYNFIKPLYGVYELPEKYRSIFVVEGPFNLWSLTQWGKCGVALLGTGTSNQLEELLKLKCKNFVLALDPDDAGRNGTNKIIKFLLEHNRKNIFVMLLPDGKDINDLTQEEFRKIEITTYKEWKYIYKMS